jgi:hypothetical protein
MSGPHDLLFRFAFSRPEVVRSELRAVAPPSLVSRLDLSSLEPWSTTLVDPSLRPLSADVVYRVPLDGFPAYVCVLFEHQSTADPRMPRRLLRYIMELWSTLPEVDAGDEGGRLPYVLPLLVEHAPGGAAPRRLSSMYALPSELLPVARAVGPELCALVDDLGAVSEAELWSRSPDPLYRLALSQLRTRGNGEPDRVEPYRDALGALESVDPDALRAVLRYVAEVATVEEPVVLSAARLAGGEARRESMITYSQRLIEKGRQEGIEEGRQEGRQEGRREGLQSGARRVLARLLELRFGRLSPAVEARLDAADEARLLAWSERVLTASSLEDALAEG